jgi:TetR/AcrR family transcriptional regulator, transcriptional repressor for nem operon
MMTVVEQSPAAVHGRVARVKARTNTRELLVRCGVEVFCELGFQATGIEELLKRVGVPKGSFYHFFDSKRDFGVAVVDKYAAYFEKKLRRSLEDESLQPLERIRAFVEDAKQGMAKFGFTRGCLVGNLSQELAGFDPQFRAQLEAVLRSWQGHTAACLQLAIDDGAIPAHFGAAALAEFFWIGWEGAILRAKLTQDVEPLESFAANFLRLAAA